MTLLALISYALVGIVAGLLGGLLGIGGGLVTVPALLFIFQQMNFPPDHLMQLAVGTSLGAMVFTSASSAWSHHLMKGVNWDFFRALSPGIVLGAILGAIVADLLSNRALQVVFGICECLIGLYFLLPVKNEVSIKRTGSPNTLIFAVIGNGIGLISTILGIGGGILTVPVLTAFHVPIRNAISTSAATGFIIALAGAISFLYLGLNEALAGGGIGYLYLPALISIGITSSLAAPYGAKAAYILPTTILRRIFSLLLIIIGISFLKG